MMSLQLEGEEEGVPDVGESPEDDRVWAVELSEEASEQLLQLPGILFHPLLSYHLQHQPPEVLVWVIRPLHHRHALLTTLPATFDGSRLPTADTLASPNSSCSPATGPLRIPDDLSFFLLFLLILVTANSAESDVEEDEDIRRDMSIDS